MLDRAAILLCSTLVFFLFRVLTVKELEDIPWNIILLFSGAMSIGFCLWQTGAAQWMAVEWLLLFQKAHWLVFVLSVATFVLILTNFIMNVAAIAISLPVSLVIAQYLGVAPEPIFYASLVTAGMPFVLLICNDNRIYFYGMLHYDGLATIALAGAGLLLLVSGTKEPHHILAECEWATLFFFMGLFMIIGNVVIGDSDVGSGS